jgi:4-amino-4-deoxy-L-arabinose transferase-like glycosyltransferase/tetratricopeptide (TPR) repeat protein
MPTAKADSGARAASDPPPWLAIVAGLVLLWIYAHGIASNPLKWEEPRRCLVAMEMIHSGNYVVPQVMGEPYLKKPPLQNWLVVLASGNDMRRVGALSLRAISLLALGATCLMLWRLGASSTGGASLQPVLVFATLGAVVQAGRSGDVDTLFSFLVLAALGSFELGRRKGSPWLQWFVPQLFVAAGILTKLIAPLFFYPPVLFLAWRQRRKFPLAPLPFACGLVAVAAVVSAWLVPYSMHFPMRGLTGSWLAELLTRTTAYSWAAFGRHVLLYPVLVVGWMLPWSLLFLLPGPTPWRSLRDRVRSDPWLLLCATAVVWGAVAFLFVPEHRGRYLLPVAPFVSALVVARFAHGGEAREDSWTRRWPLWIAAMLVWAGAVGVFWFLEPWPAAVVMTSVLGLLVLWAFGYARVHEGSRAALPLLLPLGLVYGVTYAGILESREATRNARYTEAARRIAGAIQEDVPIVCHKDVDLKFGYALTQLVGRPLRWRVGADPTTYWIAADLADRPYLGAPVVETDLYDLWRVDEPEGWSFLGEPLFPPELPDETRADRIRKLAEARLSFAQDPDDVQATIWLGRRTAYLGHYRKAIAIYSAGLRRFPEDPRLYRHRGHRLLTLRRLDPAIADLQRAAELIEGRPDEVEPDGLPNRWNVPTSTLNSNVYYHLGLAYYVKGDLHNAERSYRRCLEFSKNPDMLCATSHWLYMTLARAGKEEVAARVLDRIHADMEVIENEAYHRLLLMYKGELPADGLLAEAAVQGGIPLATTGYGVGSWHLVHGRREQAEAIFRRIVEDGEWAAFGHIAAEADLVRLMDRRM